jgi:hypothetical protein
MLFDTNIDYFLFTDNRLRDDEIIQLQNWKIHNIDTLKSDETMDGNRWTSKYCKFILPEILKSYDVIIWVDNKRIHELNKLTYENILKIINKYPDCDVFNLKHFERSTPQEELLITINKGLENKETGEYFLNNILKDYVSNFDLPDTCFIIKKNNELVNETFEYCFKLMNKYKLKRDQNIYNFAFDKQNITPVLLNYNLDFLT